MGFPEYKTSGLFSYNSAISKTFLGLLTTASPEAINNPNTTINDGNKISHKNPL